jgi:hypothetical protein
MKDKVLKLSVLSIAVVSLSLAGCGKEKETALKTQDGRETPAGQSKAAAAEDWKEISNFAQSLEGLTFDFKDGKADLDFNFRNIEVIGSDGVPVYSYVSSLRGAIDGEGRATLTNGLSPEYTADLACEDKQCLNAEIKIHKRSGSLAGTAIVKHRSLLGANSTKISSAGSAALTSDLETGILSSLDGNDPRTADLYVQDVVGGRKSFFKLKIRFSNAHLQASDPGYFDEKEIVLSGPIGPAVKAGLGLGIRRGYVSSGSGATYGANVSFDPERFLLRAALRRYSAPREGGFGLELSAGRELPAK